MAERYSIGVFVQGSCHEDHRFGIQRKGIKASKNRVGESKGEEKKESGRLAKMQTEDEYLWKRHLNCVRHRRLKCMKSFWPRIKQLKNSISFHFLFQQDVDGVRSMR